MANIVWSGNQVSRSGTATVAVTAVAAGGTVTAAINSKTETYTATASDTTITAATNAVAAFAASPIPEFGLVSWTNPSDGTILGTTPSDGRPVTITYGAAGGCTVGSTTTVAATSAHSVSDAANYVGGVLPTNLDVLHLQGDAPDLLYGLSALTGLTVSLVRREDFSGSVGLSDWHPLGFLEYLPTRLELAGTSLTVSSGGTGTTRIKSTAGSAVTVYARGEGAAEVLEITGLPASSILDVNRMGVVLAPLQGDTALVVTALVANQSSLRTGAGATITACTVKDAQANLGGPVTTLTVDKNATVTGTLAAAYSTLVVAGGTYNHNSTGTLGTVTIGSAGVVDLTLAPAAVTTSGITVNSGGSFRDPYKRVSSYTVSGDDWADVRASLDIGTAFTITVT